MSADVDQLTRHRVGGGVCVFPDGLVAAADRGQSQHRQHRVEQPATAPAVQLPRARTNIQITSASSTGGHTQFSTVRTESPNASRRTPPRPINSAGTTAHRWGCSVYRVERTASIAHPRANPHRAAPVTWFSSGETNGARTRSTAAKSPVASDPATIRPIWPCLAGLGPSSARTRPGAVGVVAMAPPTECGAARAPPTAVSTFRHLRRYVRGCRLEPDMARSAGEAAKGVCSLAEGSHARPENGMSGRRGWGILSRWPVSLSAAGEGESALTNCGIQPTASTAVIRRSSTPARAMTSMECAASAPTSSSTISGSLLRRDAACRAHRWIEALVAA